MQEAEKGTKKLVNDELETKIPTLFEGQYSPKCHGSCYFTNEINDGNHKLDPGSSSSDETITVSEKLRRSQRKPEVDNDQRSEFNQSVEEEGTSCFNCFSKSHKKNVHQGSETENNEIDESQESNSKCSCLSCLYTCFLCI